MDAGPFERAIRQWRPDAVITDFTPIEAGATNTAAKLTLTDGQTLFVKHILATPREQWASQRHMMQQLQDLGFPALYPLFVRDEPGELLEVYAYTADSTLSFSKAFLCGEAGRLLARLHRTKTDYHRPWPLCYAEAWKMRQTIDAPPLPEEADFWHRFRTLHEELFNPAPPFVHCHGDTFYDNLLFVTETETYLIDFEDSFYGPWLGDVGVAVMALGYRDGAWLPDRVKALITGYREGFGQPVAFPNLGKWAQYGALARTWWRLRHVLLGNTRITGRRDWREYLSVGDVMQALGDSTFCEGETWTL